MDRLFTDEELEEMSTRTIDKAKKAIDEGDAERAKELVDLMYSQFAHLHDGYMTWVSGLQSYLYKHYGLEVLEEAEREAHEIEARLVFKPRNEPTVKDVVKGLANGLHGHVFQPMTITETDDEIIMTVNPCGSGGRLMDMGGYDPEIGLMKIKEPCRITFGLEDFPIYCIHCPVMEAQSMERTGNLSFVRNFKGGKINSCCEYHFYKNPADIPEHYYEEIGKEKPTAAE